MTDEELADVLEQSQDPLELARATIQVVARRLSRDVRDSKDTGQDVALKKALEELRRTEQGYLEMSVLKKDLIQRDTAKALAGNVAARFVAALDRYEVALAKQIETWLADPVFQKLETEERTRLVRAWCRERSRNARQVEADDLEKWIVEEEKS